MKNGLINTYHYDQYGYYEGVVTTQVLDGAALMPPCCIATAPEVKEGFFYKINDTDDGWIAEAKPKSAKDCIGLVVKHEDNSDRGCELKKLMQEFCNADPAHFKIVRAGDLSWSVEAIPEKTLEELKAEKVQELSNEAGQYDQFKCNSMYIISSVKALKINADVRSQNNIRSLIEHYQDPVTFKTFDNSYETLTKEQLETLLLECVKNGESLYQQKWEKQQEIANAQTKEELEAIEVQLNMTDFSAQL